MQHCFVYHRFRRRLFLSFHSEEYPVSATGVFLCFCSFARVHDNSDSLEVTHIYFGLVFIYFEWIEKNRPISATSDIHTREHTQNMNSFATQTTLNYHSGSIDYFSLRKLEQQGYPHIATLPYSIKVLIENMLRNEDGNKITADTIKRLLTWSPHATAHIPIPFMPARVLLQDFTGVPAVVDLAAMRDAAARLHGNPLKVNPQLPVELVIDHSIQVDSFGTADSARTNEELEFSRNSERYTLLKWAQRTFSNFSVVPPGTGICHQVNLEYLARVVFRDTDKNLAYPDTVIGTDSHTTMINGLGVVGWGVGGIEAEAVMMGQPYYMLVPDVTGVCLVNRLPDGVMATDLVLTITQKLRAQGVVGSFVEFFGPGLTTLSVEDRATVANMAPEYGATMGYFPVDAKTIEYLTATGRSKESVDCIEAYTKAQGLFREADAPDPAFSSTVIIDLATIVRSIAGPKRPQERIDAEKVHSGVDKLLGTATSDRTALSHGSVVIAAITSCTNTSNPAVLLTAALLARNAAARGLHVKPWVKTSFAPGSKVVMAYLEKAGLMRALEALQFHHVGNGCTTCIGNSGPLPDTVSEKIRVDNLTVAAVLSGNRNFEGRIHPLTKLNYLASPAMVVAYAIAGTVSINMETDPLGTDTGGIDVYLRDIWPHTSEISAVARNAIHPDLFTNVYGSLFDGSPLWQNLTAAQSPVYPWSATSSYIKTPPFFTSLQREPAPIADICAARALAVLGDSVTTDHISPAGTIPMGSPAGAYLLNCGVRQEDFNSYGSRRGNHEVMVRGTFGNIRLQNCMVPGKQGGWTILLPEDRELSIYEAAMEYRLRNTPLIIIAGKEYGTGSSRDWAAKGTMLLGVAAVIAESFERIHRSNLIGMGVLPLEFAPGENSTTLGLTGRETFSITGINSTMLPGAKLTVTARNLCEMPISFIVTARIDSVMERTYYTHRGILPYVLRHL